MKDTSSNLIETITFRGVNCYLIKTKKGFILVDSGYTNQRSNIESFLNNTGVKRGNLAIILLTHGDFDHSGNCAYFRDKYQSKIAMHVDDLGMVEQGGLFASRRGPNIIIRTIAKLLLPILRMNLRKKDYFTPDIFLEEGDDLSEYGLNAKVIHILGHSKGSIAFLTVEGDIFIGDLLENSKKKGPVKGSLMDDHLAFSASINKLKSLPIITVYPGHGDPFQMEEFSRDY